MTALLLLLSGFIPVAHASVIDQAGVNGGAGVGDMWASICETLPFCDVGNQAPQFILEKLTNFVFGLIVGVGVIMIIYAGIKLTSSGGSDEGMAQTKKTLGYAIGGIVLAILARTIVLYVAETLIPMLVGA